MRQLFSNIHLHVCISLFIIVAAVGTKWFTINYWSEQGITHVYPWFMPYVFILWGLALLFRLWYENSKLYSVYIMALALIWFGWESFSVTG